MEKFLGWANKETWALNLWIEECIQEMLQEMENEGQKLDEFTLADSICNFVEDWVFDLISQIPEDSGIVTDLTNRALGRVDWYQLARHALEVYDENLPRCADGLGATNVKRGGME